MELEEVDSTAEVDGTATAQIYAALAIVAGAAGVSIYWTRQRQPRRRAYAGEREQNRHAVHNNPARRDDHGGHGAGGWLAVAAFVALVIYASLGKRGIAPHAQSVEELKMSISPRARACGPAAREQRRAAHQLKSGATIKLSPKKLVVVSTPTSSHRSSTARHFSIELGPPLYVQSS